jgi:hypothetical protein
MTGRKTEDEEWKKAKRVWNGVQTGTFCYFCH